MNKLLSVITGYTLALSAFSLPAYAQISEKIVQSFSVSNGSEFSIHNINGGIEIKSGTDNQISVVAVKEAKSQEALERMTVVFDEKNNGVHVETKYEKNNNNHNSSGSVSYTVTLPKNMKMTEVESVNGSLVIEGVDGEVDAELVNGSIKISGLSGNSKIHAVNGSIKAAYDYLTNSVENIDIDTVNGSITLHLPQNVNANVEAETMHGGLNSTIGLKVNKNMFVGKSMSGVVGNGHTRIKLESVNGSIQVLN